MICFTVQNGVCSYFFLLHYTDMRRQCCHPIMTTRPFICFIYLEGMRELSTPDFFFLFFSITPFFTPASFSLLSRFHCLYTGRGGKSQAFLCPIGGAPRVADDSRREGAASCCDSCRAASLICGPSWSLAAFVVCADIDGWWMDSGR